MIAKKYINKLLALLILGLLIYMSYNKLVQLKFAWADVSNILYNPKMGYLIPAILLVIPNWYLESLKWHLLIKKELTSNKRFAVKSVLAGLSIGTVVPYRLGEYIGRVYLFPNNKKLKGVLLYMVGSWAQLSVTLLMGMVGAIYLGTSLFTSSLKLYVLAIVLLIFGLIYLRKKWVSYLIKRYKSQKVFKALVVLKQLKLKTIFHVFFYSWFRYLIFATQFVLFLMAFGLNFKGFIIFAKTYWMYLLQSAIPSFLPTEIGVRTLLPIQLFQEYISTDLVLGLTIASLSIYLINILLPGLVGLFFIFNAKLKKRK